MRPPPTRARPRPTRGHHPGRHGPRRPHGHGRSDRGPGRSGHRTAGRPGHRPDALLGHRPTPRPGDRPSAQHRMTLVQRRIGLMFAVFLVLLGCAALRAVWIGTVKAGTLGERAISQQVEDLEITARRGTILDRNGVELAVSEDAVTVFAHPFLIDDPGDVAARLAPLLGRPEDELIDKLGDRDESFVYLRRKMDASLGHQIEEMHIEGIDTVIEASRTLPAGPPGRAGAGDGRDREQGPVRPRVPPRRGPAGRRRRPPARGQGRAGRAGQPDRDRPRRAGRGPAPDPRLRPSRSGWRRC